MSNASSGLNPEQKNRQSQAAYQQRVLQFSLYLAFGLTLLGEGIATPGLIQRGLGFLLAILAAVTIYFGVITFVKKLPYGLRSYSLIILVMAQGAIGMFRPVVTFDGRLSFLVFILLATVLQGTRAGVIAGVLSTIAVFAYGWNLNTAPTGDFFARFTAGQLEWLGTGVIFLLMAVLTIATAAFVQNTLRAHLAQANILIDQLEDEINTAEIKNVDQGIRLDQARAYLTAYRSVSNQFIAQTDPEPVLKDIVLAMTESLNLDFSGIYLLDERKEFAKFREGSGDVGRTLVESNHRLRVGDGSLVSQAIQTREMKRVVDTSKIQTFVPTPLLAGTRAEVALPVYLNKQIAGVLDVQSDRPREFSPEELLSLEWFAGQVGLSLEKVSHLAEIERLKTELNGMYLQFTQQTWQSHLKQRRHSMSYRYRQDAIEKDIPQPPEIQEVAKKGETIFVGSSTRPLASRPVTKVAIPIKLRNQVLGVLDIQLDASKLPQDMLPLLDAAASRLAVALENARLLEEIQNRAEREHLVSNISAKIRNSTNVDQVLRTTAAEIGRSFGISEVLVQLRPSDTNQGQLS